MLRRIVDKLGEKGLSHMVRLSIKKVCASFSLKKKQAGQVRFHRETMLNATPATVDAGKVVDDLQLIRRLTAAYQKSTKSDLGESMWKHFFISFQEPIHEALMAGEESRIAEIYRFPANNDLFYGFDIFSKSLLEQFSQESVREGYAKACLDGLVRFAESVGAIALDNPETWPAAAGKPYDPEEILAKLDLASWPFSVPTPFPGEPGLKTSRGILSYRVSQALYQAWRIKQLVKDVESPRVLEIGAGLGRTAYYAYELGIKDYTVVDIPLTLSAQAYFLGRTLGEDYVCLDGESTTDSSDKVKIFTPQTFLDGDEKYDLIVNVDSLTEMDASIASSYWQKIKSSTNLFLSINHESNRFRVQDFIAKDSTNFDISRELYWMRNGYVEELVNILDG